MASLKKKEQLVAEESLLEWTFVWKKRYVPEKAPSLGVFEGLNKNLNMALLFHSLLHFDRFYVIVIAKVALEQNLVETTNIVRLKRSCKLENFSPTIQVSFFKVSNLDKLILLLLPTLFRLFFQVVWWVDISSFSLFAETVVITMRQSFSPSEPFKVNLFTVNA